MLDRVKLWFASIPGAAALRDRMRDPERRRMIAIRPRANPPWRFKILYKLVLIAALSNLPVFLLGDFFVTHSLKEMRFAAKERQGISYLLEVLPAYGAALLGRVEASPSLGTRYDLPLGTGDQRKRFEQAISAGGKDAIAAGQDLIHRIADNSSLSVDPDLSTLDAVGIVTTELPDVAAAARDLFASLRDKRSGADPAAALSRFEQAAASLSDSLNTTDALNADAQLGEKLTEAQIAMDAAQKDLATRARGSAAEGGGGLAKSDSLAVAYQQYQTSLAAFWQIATQSLDLLLARRTDGLRNQLIDDVATAGALLVLVSVLVWLLSRSITTRLTRLREVMDDMRQGNLEVEIPPSKNSDEVGAMARALQVFKNELIEKRKVDETLRLQNEILQQRQSELQTQNLRFDAALNNMAHGFCMFDRDRKLVIHNRRYSELYGLPPGFLKPGMTLEEVLSHRIAHGNMPVGGTEAYIRRRIELVTNGAEDADVIELQDGRVLSVLHHPMADGGWVSTHQEITDLRRSEARIRHLARHDALTNLPNRTFFHERMEATEPLIRRGENMAVLWVDLDHFKSVNDTLGHGMGDAVLVAAATRLVASCRETDVVARFGGDEFVVLQNPIQQPEDAALLADRIVKAIAEPFDIDDHRVLIGASVGIAVAPVDGQDAESLMRNADLALYRAKSDGRGAYHFYEQGMDAILQKRRSIEVGLRFALARGELRLVFQPLFNLKDQRICTLEALLRWDDPERGAISPVEFVPIAEETGQIIAIGEWVLREACLAAATWPDRVSVAVNLSPLQFKNRNLIQHVTSALAVAGLRPDRLELEITESVLLADNDLALTMLHELRHLGVRISMDDFGTGYSSLSYLRSFPFDKIKIDQSFVRDSSSNADSLAIVKAVIGLGRSLGMATTVEGVETEAQLDLVRSQGCTEVQGFLFSPPLPGSAITTLFAETDGALGRHADRKAAS